MRYLRGATGAAAPRKKVRSLAPLGLMLASLLVVACTGSSRHVAVGSIVADSGFRPSQSGFPFQNYGGTLSDGSVPTNLTVADVRILFGDGVCVDAKTGECDLIPEAQAWQNSINEDIAGGHCYGFAVASELLWQRKLNVKTLGATSIAGLAINDNVTLQRQLAYDWALQTLASVQSRRITGTPRAILANLRRVLKPHAAETYTLVFWKADGTGGHAVTPYALRYMGGGRFDVLIYDNNWPDQTRAVHFDTKTDTWSYDAAINPDQPDELYKGNAATNTISLWPTSPGLGTQPCPFCGKVPNSPSKSGGPTGQTMQEIYVLSSVTHHANLIVRDDAGRRLGYINGKLVDEIPGAQPDEVISNEDWQDNLEPNFFVPANGRYTLTLDGSTLSSPDTETVGVIGPAYDESVSNIQISSGDRDTLVVEPDATKLSYTSSRDESPTLNLGVSDNHADYTFALTGLSHQAATTANLILPPEGNTLTLNIVGSRGPSTVNLQMSRSTEEGVQTFTHDAIPLAGGDTAGVQFAGWTNASQALPLVVTHDGQRSTQTLTNHGTG